MSGIDKAKNKAEELQGHGKESLGRATDDPDLEAEGNSYKTRGKLMKAGDKVKVVFR